MHPEAYTGFGWALSSSELDPDKPWRILDVGGQHINGSVHDYFPNAEITTLDLENADIIADARVWTPDRLFDIVIATEVFEHVEEWEAIVETMWAALDPAGPEVLLITCASTNRLPHGATGAPLPVDGEWYQNVDPKELRQVLFAYFDEVDVQYKYPPGDAYAWARVNKRLW